MIAKRSGFAILLVLITLLLPGNSGRAGRVQADGSRSSSPLFYRPADGLSQKPSISADGRFVVFDSTAGNLVHGDQPGTGDVFVYDRLARKLERVSVRSDGNPANGESGLASISDDGRFVSFVSLASDLVPDDTNGFEDVFVHDRQTGETMRVSVDSDGNQALAGGGGITILSGDGRNVMFFAFMGDIVSMERQAYDIDFQIHVHDRSTGETRYVSVSSEGIPANGPSFPAGFSVDGRFIAFSSNASNLVLGDTNEVADAFIHDQSTGETLLVSVTLDQSLGNGDSSSGLGGISADGRFVTFASSATNMIPDDLNGFSDVFVRDRQTGSNDRVSVAADGGETNADSMNPSISADGRFVVFVSYASNLVPGDSNNIEDIFVHDRETGQTERISIATDGSQANKGSNYASISADGRFVAFESDASSLVPGDTNNQTDVFLHDRLTGITEIISVGYLYSVFFPLINN